ncbi:MAG: hypothetical protein H7235_05150 [Bdellovibrionaceae bacterium]|nr:hypothetical protein [Pseudobdellovibrionaceae bacterium]
MESKKLQLSKFGILLSITIGIFAFQNCAPVGKVNQSSLTGKLSTVSTAYQSNIASSTGVARAASNSNQQVGAAYGGETAADVTARQNAPSIYLWQIDANLGLGTGSFHIGAGSNFEYITAPPIACNAQSAGTVVKMIGRAYGRQTDYIVRCIDSNFSRLTAIEVSQRQPSLVFGEARASEMSHQEAQQETQRLANIAAEVEARRLAFQAAQEQAKVLAAQTAQSQAQQAALIAAQEEAKRLAQIAAQAEAKRLFNEAASRAHPLPQCSQGTFSDNRPGVTEYKCNCTGTAGWIPQRDGCFHRQIPIVDEVAAN